MKYSEQAVVFDCAGDALVGVLSRPDAPVDVGMIVVVGGPQYRAGSHRQFVRLARHCAAHRIAVLRFDYRGMGDSAGNPRLFDTVDEDIAAAIEALKSSVPAVRKVVLWGLCDGAAAALIATRTRADVVGVIALNPWVRSEETINRTFVKHYYARRLISPELWKKLLTGRLSVAATVGEFFRRARSALRARPDPDSTQPAVELSFQDRMLEGVQAVRSAVLFVLSERDLTAKEFLVYSEADSRWKRALSEHDRISMCHIAGADHTFSSAGWRADVERLSSDFALRFVDPPSTS